jgi:hypothetical protein
MSTERSPERPVRRTPRKPSLLELIRVESEQILKSLPGHALLPALLSPPVKSSGQTPRHAFIMPQPSQAGNGVAR